VGIGRDEDIAQVLAFLASDEAASRPEARSGAGSHYVQEDSPDEIGKAIVEWIRHFAPNKQRV
jgi:hypothetical protein